jgi:hypothetical protein
VVWPVLWLFVFPTEVEITVGRQPIAAAEEVLGKRSLQHLLVDRSSVDGAWLTTLHQHGTRVTIGVRKDMLMLEEMVNLSRLPSLKWQEVAPPKIREDPKPQREIMSLPAMKAEWSACLIPDTYPDR